PEEKLPSVFEKMGAARGRRNRTVPTAAKATAAHTATIAATLTPLPVMPLRPGTPGKTGKTGKASNGPHSRERRGRREMCGKVLYGGTQLRVGSNPRRAAPLRQIEGSKLLSSAASNRRPASQ